MILKRYRLGHLRKGPIVKFIKGLPLLEIDEEMQLMIVGCLWHNYKPRKVVPFIPSFSKRFVIGFGLPYMVENPICKLASKLPTKLLDGLLKCYLICLGGIPRGLDHAGHPYQPFWCLLTFIQCDFQPPSQFVEFAHWGSTCKFLKP
jgi:hypothetical protein